MSGLRGFEIGTPFPMGCSTKSRNSLRGLHDNKFITFAVSMTEPPPTATSASNCCVFANSPQVWKEESVGSLVAPSKRVKLIPEE